MGKIENHYFISRNNDIYIDKTAMGYSARVFYADSLRTGDEIAFKIMRLQHLHDKEVWQQFETEVALLVEMADNPRLVHLVDCGFVSEMENEIPLQGDMFSCGQDPELFAAKLPSYFGQEWRPYISLERIPAKHSLHRLIRGADGRNTYPMRLTIDECLSLAYQFGEFLAEAHSKDIVYIDHKPEHAYWDGKNLRIIDMNVSRKLDPMASKGQKRSEIQTDLRNFAVGVLFSALTGRDHRFNMVAAQPSAPGAVEDRFLGVETLNFRDEPISPSMVSLVNTLVRPGSDLTADDFLDGIVDCAAEVGWNLKGSSQVAEDAMKARKIRLEGLREMREAQKKIARAKDFFSQAMRTNPDDVENSRLYRKASDFYLQRFLP